MTDMTLNSTEAVGATPSSDASESVVEHVAEQVAEHLAHAKPLLRGWLHEIMFFISIPAGLLLVAFAPTVEARFAAVVYSIGVSALYGVSAAYHRGPWTAKGRKRMQRLDHAMIYILIAATYTPFCLLLLEGTASAVALAAIWAVAVAGLVLALTGIALKRGIGFVLYLAMGWAAVFALPQFLSQLTPVQLGLMLAGGLLYTVGAIFLGTHWPDPFPKVFGYHEVWHVMTVIAGILLAVDIWMISLAHGT